MHVLHYIPNFLDPVGGGEIFGHELVQQLQRFSIRQTIITYSRCDVCTVIKPSNSISVIRLPVRKSFGAYWILEGLVSILLGDSYDVIHFQGYGSYAADVACILKRLRVLKSSLVITSNGMSGLKHGYMSLSRSFSVPFKERIPRMLHLVYDLSMGKMEFSTFDKVIILSSEEEKYFSKSQISRMKIVNIPIAINDVFFNQESFADPSVLHHKRYVLFVGRMDKYKGIEVLLKSIELLKKTEGLDLNCIIVGRDVGYKNTVERLIERCGISDNIRLIDGVSQDNLVDIYKSALVTVLPSLSEGFPLCLVESMATGIPFIATPVGIIPQLVKDSEAGVLMPLNDYVDLAKKILDLRNNPHLWQEMSANGKAYAPKFNWNSISKAYYDLYRDLLISKRN